jgi:hypothetical protein
MFPLLVRFVLGDKIVNLIFFLILVVGGGGTPVIILRLWEIATRFTNSLQERNYSHERDLSAVTSEL